MSSKYTRIGRHSNIISNFSIRIVGNVINKALSLITLPIIANSLGPTGYGKYNLINIISQYTMFFVLFGFIPYGIREVAKNIENSEIVNEIISVRLTIGLISLCISAVICFILYYPDSFFIAMILVSYLTVFANAGSFDFFFYGKNNMSFPTWTQTAGQLIFTICVFIFIHDKTSLIILIIISSISTLIPTYLQYRKYSSAHKVKIKLSIRKSIEYIRKLYKLGLSQKVESLQSTLPALLVAIFLNTYALGIYSAADRLFSLYIIIYSSIMTAFAPYLVKLSTIQPTKKGRYLIILLFSTVCAGICLGLFNYFFGAEIIMLLFGDKFNLSIPLFKIMALTIIPLWPISMIINNIFIFFNKEQYYLYTLLVGFISLVLSAPYLILKMNLEGAIYSLTISIVSSIIISFYFLLKTEKDISQVFRSLMAVRYNRH